jgi:multidrug efflux pump subunit AcrA (membrane-fusion protein)
VTVQELPDAMFPGMVTRTSSSLDAGSRTLLTEVQVDNRGGKLLPGMYAQVQFMTARKDPPFLVPDAALVVRSDGTWLAFLSSLTAQELEQLKAQGVDSAMLAQVRRVHFQRVQPGRDYGIQLEILDRLRVGQEVVVDPTDAVQEGAIVQVASSSGAK